MKEFVAQNSYDRLDKFLVEKMPELTRSKIKKFIDEELVSVNDKFVKAGYEIKPNDVVTVEEYEEEKLNANPENIPLDIVYEDDDLIVVNKPQGMVVHPAVGNYSGTLVNALCYRYKHLSTINGSFRPGIVHRLDKDTSGLLLVAKNDFAHQNLSEQISTKACKRHYMAVLEGNLKEDSGTVQTNIARSVKNRQKMEVCGIDKGKLAITNFEVVSRINGYTVVHFELKTGRTHQIRVHASYLGHPVVGDEVYGFKNKHKGLNGQLLHAYKICFTQPTTKKPLEFEVDLPDYFKEFIKKNS